ncbi:glycosyltransferase family 2 protein [Brachymonas denitrificans]|uniref:Glycosyltransferase involved in cell wall bisynthesis n=1 Tax=Brachymonas denitrificans DSM 15123 TaxID=1121117 RepID=A0A1H8JVJ8_9BURK|nr:glycosyltransferase [Brachymonas denitrificans]SEN84238.1 Glycosyltransferase involved in cell wall bisynthesis [Brachymonas denitrificans DSM 15123]
MSNPSEMTLAIRPRVSVVVGAKNEEKYVRVALMSILSQGFDDLELIFVDDKSSDRTKEIALEISSMDSRLKVFDNEMPGKPGVFNYGVGLATGDFICLFAGDDIMPEGSLWARYMMVKDNSPDELVVGLSKLQVMSEDKSKDGMVIPRKKGVGGYSGVSFMMSRGMLGEIFPVPDFLPNEDTWMELAAKHLDKVKIINSGIVACKWRMHQDNSKSMTMPFDIYNDRMSRRFDALSTFLRINNNKMNDQSKRLLEARVKCEELRRHGDVLGIFLCELPMVDRLRALSLANSFMYAVRGRFFKLFSGW